VGSVAEVFSATVRDAGIGHVFGFPGGATVELAERARLVGVEFVLAHSEWSAGYMAGMYGDLTGRPGVVLTTVGPGATNVVNATANALLDRSPMLTITGRHGLGAGTHAHQRLNQVSLMEAVTKWSTTIEAPAFPAQLHRAMRIALAERPGPVHLDLPSDQPDAATGELGAPDPLPCVRYGVPQGVEEAAARLRQARRPVVVAGYTALRLGAGAGLRDLAERWGIPVVTTPKAKGVLPETHPYWAGVIEMAGPHYMNEFLGQADLLIAAGLDAVELILPWKHRMPVVHVDSLPNTDEVYLSELDLVGDVGGALAAVATLAPEGPRWTESEIAQHRQEYLRRNVVGSDAGLAPSRVVFAARELLDETALVISDVGSHKMLLGGLWKTVLPHTFFMSNGLGTMGFSLPAAIAAQLVHPDRRVVSFVGDGGLAMVSGELGTAVDRGLPIVVVVFNDRALDRILRKQESEGYPAIGTTFGNPDLVKLAEAHGAAGFRARTEAEFLAALEQALAAGAPALIDAQIETREYQVQFSA
jgi:acetolactate synthase-1/2/3 large subunit